MLAQARAKLDAQSSYHLRLQDAAGNTEIDYMPPERVRIFMPGSVALIVGGSVYLNAAGSGWVPAGANPTLLILMRALEEDDFIVPADGDQVSDQGQEMLDGVPTHRYEVRTPANGSALVREIWVGAKDGLPRRVERDTGGAKLTVTYSRFNQDFGIDVPQKLAAPAMGTPTPRKNPSAY
jgi:hypothetical protein